MNFNVFKPRIFVAKLKAFALSALPISWQQLCKPKVFLFEELQDKFSVPNIFQEILELQGEVARDMHSRKTIRFFHGDQYYYAKVHFGIGWREIFKDLFQGRWPVLGARDEFRAILRLHTLGIDTLNCVGFGERGLNPAHRKSFIITREISQAISLEDLTKTWTVTPPSFIFKRNLIAKIAAIARTLHNHGLNHRDFYLGHFLWVSEQSQPFLKKNALYLIDLHRVQLRKHTPERWRIKDLGGLYYSALGIALSQHDLLYFIKKYHGKPLKEIFQEEGKFWNEVRDKALYLQEHLDV